jgi:hypothetical protein
MTGARYGYCQIKVDLMDGGAACARHVGRHLNIPSTQPQTVILSSLRGGVRFRGDMLPENQDNTPQRHGQLKSAQLWYRHTCIFKASPFSNRNSSIMGQSHFCYRLLAVHHQRFKHHRYSQDAPKNRAPAEKRRERSV